MIVDPWGVVLAQAPDAETLVMAELDLELQREVRWRLPSLANRRPSAYHRPREQTGGRGGGGSRSAQSCA